MTLPDATVTIETTGESRIGTMTTAACKLNQSPSIQLTFSGSGKLTFQKRLRLDGNAGDRTISQGAYVIAEEGIVSGDSGGHSSVTVNGTLEAKGYNDGTYDNPALYTGKVVVGDNGVLEVSGAEGVMLNGVGGDSGGSSGGSSHETTYTVTVEEAEHGKVVSDRRTASRGSTVTMTVSPDEGYETGTLTVTDRNGKTLDVTDKGSGGIYTFIMPGGSVSVRAVFNKITADYEACARDSGCPIWPFTGADANACITMVCTTALATV